MNINWEYDPTDRTSGAPEAIWNGGQVIARIEDVGGPTRGNGRLIAAAPDLLEALQAVFSILDSTEIPGSPGSPLEKARAAIAKALPELDYDGAPYCSYGHKTKASCDCGPIAANE